MTYSVNCHADYSKIHGLGCFASKKVEKGAIIGAFTGEWLVLDVKNGQPVYPLGIDGRYCIDVAFYDDMCIVLAPDVSRLKDPLDRINHSEDPNCRVHGLAVVADGEIAEGEELTIDYRSLDCTDLTFHFAYRECRAAIPASIAAGQLTPSWE